MHNSFGDVYSLRANALLYLVGPSLSPWHSRDDILLRNVWRVTWIMFEGRKFCFKKTNFACETSRIHAVGMKQCQLSPCGVLECPSESVLLILPLPPLDRTMFLSSLRKALKGGLYIKYKVRWAVQTEFASRNFFFPCRTWVIIGLGFTDTEGVSGGPGTGSKPCHLNDFVNISSVNLNQNAALHLFFLHHPPNFILSLVCRCKYFRPLFIFFRILHASVRLPIRRAKRLYIHINL